MCSIFWVPQRLKGLWCPLETTACRWVKVNTCLLRSRCCAFQCLLYLVDGLACSFSHYHEGDNGNNISYTSVENRILCLLLSGVGMVSSWRKYSNTCTYSTKNREAREHVSEDISQPLLYMQVKTEIHGTWYACTSWIGGSAHLWHDLQRPAIPHRNGLCGVGGDLAVLLCRS